MDNDLAGPNYLVSGDATRFDYPNMLSALNETDLQARQAMYGPQAGLAAQLRAEQGQQFDRDTAYERARAEAAPGELANFLGYFTPAAPALSARDAYHSALNHDWLGTGLGALGAVPLLGMVTGPMGKAAGMVNKARDIDPLGYYSGAFEAAKNLKQARGTPEQMLAQLRAAGAKDADIEATGLTNFLQGRTSVTQKDLEDYLSDNRIRLDQSIYAPEVANSGKLTHADATDNFLSGIEIRPSEEGYGFDIFHHGTLLDLTDEPFATRAEAEAFARESVTDHIGNSGPEAWGRGTPLDQRSAGPAKWQQYSLDPNNPTYRETVLHLPAREQENPARYSVVNFHSGHFHEPNIVGHMMTSLVKDEQGNKVFNVDQIQSDWGQRLRDKGVLDTAKIARLEQDEAAANKRLEDAKLSATNLITEHGHLLAPKIGESYPWGREYGANGKAMWSGQHPVSGVTTTPVTIGGWNGKVDFWPETYGWNGEPQGPRYVASTDRGEVQNGQAKSFDEALKTIRDAYERGGPVLHLGDIARSSFEAGNHGVTDSAHAAINEMRNSAGEIRRIGGELDTAKAATPGHPLVNTTDQWVNTTLRHAIRQAAESGADHIAIPSGSTVLSYNPGDVNGMNEFYNNIVPKNLKNLLRKIDPESATAKYHEQLHTPNYATGKGFTVFPLTDKVKRAVMENGQPLFGVAAPLTAGGLGYVASDKDNE